MKKLGGTCVVALVVVAFAFMVIPRIAFAGPNVKFEIYPTKVFMAPLGKVQFTALYTKDGVTSTPGRTKWTVKYGGFTSTPGLYRAPGKACRECIVTAIAEGQIAKATVVVKDVKPATKRRDPKPAIFLKKFKKKVTGALPPGTKRVSATVSIGGKKVRKLKVSAIDSKNKVIKVIFSKECTHGDTFDFYGTYSGPLTRIIRFEVLDVRNRVLATKSMPD